MKKLSRKKYYSILAVFTFLAIAFPLISRFGFYWMIGTWAIVVLLYALVMTFYIHPLLKNRDEDIMVSSLTLKLVASLSPYIIAISGVGIMLLVSGVCK